MATDGNESAEESILIKKSKECSALAESVHSSISKKSIDNVEQKLETLRKDAKELAKYAEKKAKETEAEEEKCMKEIEEIQRSISQLALEEERLKELELSLYGKQLALYEMHQTLSNAESDLRTAEDRVHIARREEELRVGGGVVFGAIISSLLAPGLGTVIGAAAGAAGAGELLNELIDEERTAYYRVDDCRRRCQNTKADVQSIRSQISNIQSQITHSLSSQCADVNHQQEQYTIKVKEMKNTVLFFRNASQFWKQFQQTAESADKNTELMQVIVSKAKEKQDLECLIQDGSKALCLSFLEAWALIEIKCEEGSEIIFQTIDSNKYQ